MLNIKEITEEEAEAFEKNAYYHLKTRKSKMNYINQIGNKGYTVLFDKRDDCYYRIDFTTKNPILRMVDKWWDTDETVQKLMQKYRKIKLRIVNG
jgi:hypothetical protein